MQPQNIRWKIQAENLKKYKIIQKALTVFLGDVLLSLAVCYEEFEHSYESGRLQCASIRVEMPKRWLQHDRVVHWPRVRTLQLKNIIASLDLNHPHNMSHDVIPYCLPGRSFQLFIDWIMNTGQVPVCKSKTESIIAINRNKIINGYEGGGVTRKFWN